MSNLQCDALVIGGGLAGGSVAFALQRRGLRVIMCESGLQLAQKASGNAYGLIMPYIADRPSLFERTYECGFEFTRDLLRSQFAAQGLLLKSGGLQLPSTQRLRRLLDTDGQITAPTPIIKVTSSKASSLSGIKIASSAFYVPEAGFLNPGRLVAEMTVRGVTILTSERVVQLERKTPRWSAHLASGRAIDATIAVICGAHESQALAPACALPLEPVRGQTLLVSPTADSARLKTLVCFDGYITPTLGGATTHLLGAHYRHDDLRREGLAQDSEEIMRRCKAWLPSLFQPGISPDSARVCFRTSTIDRLPYVGELPDFGAMQKEAQRFQPGTDILSKMPASSLPNLYVSVGHGSRGLISCPMSGEIVARLAMNEALGDLAEVSAILSPRRLISRILAST